MSEEFRNLLKRLVDANFTSRRGFIRAAEPTVSEDGAVGNLSRVIAGKLPPPLARIESWADALHLIDEGRDDFINLAVLEHIDVAIRPKYQQIFKEHRELKTAAEKRSRKLKRS